MINFVVFGYPIKHSKSPFIHQQFSMLTGIDHQYDTYLVEPGSFPQVVQSFFSLQGQGAHVTLPFKQQAFVLADELTERAMCAGAVNTLKKLADGRLLGDNTDGVGLLTDLQRLDMVKPGDKILLLGAGGAARGAIQPLLEYGCQVVICNRTPEKAQQLVAQFPGFKQLKVFQDHDIAVPFNLVINATSSGVNGEVPQLPDGIFDKVTGSYDMFYQKGMTPFLQVAKNFGVSNIADGVGMLVGQAAHAFHLWHGVMPETEAVIDALRAALMK